MIRSLSESMGIIPSLVYHAADRPHVGAVQSTPEREKKERKKGSGISFEGSCDRTGRGTDGLSHTSDSKRLRSGACLTPSRVYVESTSTGRPLWVPTQRRQSHVAITSGYVCSNP